MLDIVFTIYKISGQKISELTLKFVEVEPQIKLIGSNAKVYWRRGSETGGCPCRKDRGSFEMFFSKALGRLIYNKAFWKMTI